MTDAELAEEKRLAHDRAVASDVGPGSLAVHRSSSALVFMAWLAVSIPLAWGIYRTSLSVPNFSTDKLFLTFSVQTTI